MAAVFSAAIDDKYKDAKFEKGKGKEKDKKKDKEKADKLEERKKSFPSFKEALAPSSSKVKSKKAPAENWTLWYAATDQNKRVVCVKGFSWLSPKLSPSPPLSP